MGTNYYCDKSPSENEKEIIIGLIEREEYALAQKYFPERIHIGKSSGGWEFIFDHNNWEYFDKDIVSIKSFVSKCTISNEYGENVSHDKFWEMVEEKKGGLHHKKYMREWPKIHGGRPRPYYENDELDIFVDGLRFSTSTDFS